MHTDRAGKELGLYLRARRSELSPAEVGLPTTAERSRRVHGLRREEVAALASISADYYTRIEQGRRLPPSETLDAIARALRLDDAGREYASALMSATNAPQRPRRAHRVPAHLQRLLTGLADTPAVILGPYMDVLAWNDMAVRLLIDFGKVATAERNWVRLTFLDPRLRALYPDWPTVARSCVAQLRMDAARHPDDPRLTDLVGELSRIDADFRRWWGGHQISIRTRGTKTVVHPAVGRMELDWDTLIWSGNAALQLISWTAPDNTPSHDRLRALADRSLRTRG